MKGILTFVFGFLFGAVVMFSSLKYHIVRANDGMHLIPKMAADFGDSYVDIREFTLTSWNEHRVLAVALVRAEKGYLIGESAGASFRSTIDGLSDGLGGNS